MIEETSRLIVQFVSVSSGLVLQPLLVESVQSETRHGTPWALKLWSGDGESAGHLIRAEVEEANSTSQKPMNTEGFSFKFFPLKTRNVWNVLDTCSKLAFLSVVLDRTGHLTSWASRSVRTACGSWNQCLGWEKMSAAGARWVFWVSSKWSKESWHYTDAKLVCVWVPKHKYVNKQVYTCLCLKLLSVEREDALRGGPHATCLAYRKGVWKMLSNGSLDVGEDRHRALSQLDSKRVLPTKNNIEIS